MKNKIIFLLLCIFACIAVADAQQIINGKVLNKKGRPQKDMKVVLGHDTTKTMTDGFGRFTMKLDSSYIADSLLRKELIIYRDTLYTFDTIKVVKRAEFVDTVYRIDTLLQHVNVLVRDTSIKLDTVVQSIVKRDTVFKIDTLFKKKQFVVRDTIFKIDSLIERELFFVTDTMYVTDTVRNIIEVSDYISADKNHAAKPSRSRPLIGISDICLEGKVSVTRFYADAVLMAGGLPVVVPYIEDKQTLYAMLESLDGIILSGGGDIDPMFYSSTRSTHLGTVNKARDLYDFALVRIAEEKKIPILGICRGIQVINVAYGGTLYQDLPTEYPKKTVVHKQSPSKGAATHDVTLSKGSLISKITGEETLFVNSLHHQAVKKVADGFKVTGVADDGVVEVMEPIDKSRKILAVEFHPEALAHKDPAMLKIFKYFIEEAKKK